MTYLGLGYIGIGLGMGICLLGAGLGIGKLSSSALEGAARQPEAAGTLQTMMIIPAAMIEGLGLLALVVAFLGVLTLNKGVDSAAKTAGTPAAVEAPAHH
ncbi:MAG: ATP synthase F0 subunit C [Elusimicrobia bacterium]|nr:ATP synthase F0 subunit C [Elusimicrobiota bacterium]